MTDRVNAAPAPARAARPRRRKPSSYPIVAGSVALFMALFGFLAYQLRIGHDPALGNRAAIQQVVAPRRVLVKRIENRIIVTKVVPSGDDGGGSAVQIAAVPSSSTSTSGSAPVVTRSSPVVTQSAPAPVAAAPAPAAAAPVVTKTS